ncbi:DUF4197 domain-containing protein [Chitinophaga nivalis]|uniref:DUF4197 domain-containing protein n=1 Tax=Chitinophaga nivalis TaxID=2991709 RepID=A0ABT3IUG9_9BACT|nr:DUF4197 domain-containing protein [Chitinophaga nivalis]MCW3462672.1 DUF4197 domain-containing protein [Chitinophaga nivalis]MCW3487637.1 DUF4197 domain-containing protein [Chitinophaga nivalis]
MLKRSLLVLLGFFCLQASQAQFLNKLSKELKKAGITTGDTSATGTKNKGTVSAGSLTESEAGSGIKEALAKGLAAGIAKLNKTDGFFGSEVYKVLLPPDAVKIGNTLRAVGLGSQVDQAILQINRAAEKAVGYAAPIFVNAIKQMTLTDALNLVRGGNNSATEFFKSKTSNDLKAAFSPVVKGSLDSTSATRYYTDIVTTYNKLPTTFNKVNPDLQDYVTTMAVNALFDQIGKEEAAIRANPAARTTDLLKKVFGSK